MQTTPTQPDPLTSSQRSADPRDRLWSLYADDQLVPHEAVNVALDGERVTITITTSRTALVDPASVPAVDLAWGGVKPGDTVQLQQPGQVGSRPWPSAGACVVEAIVPAEKPGGGSEFRVRALTDLFDYGHNEVICRAGEQALVPAAWLPRR